MTAAMGTGDVPEPARPAASAQEKLDEITTRHRAIARYRVYLSAACGSERGRRSRCEVLSGLRWEEATELRGEVTAILRSEGQTGFGATIAGIELVNTWETLSHHARARMYTLGKSATDFEAARNEAAPARYLTGPIAKRLVERRSST